MAERRSTTKGFKRTASLLGDRIRRAGESRGFAVSRLLTHWPEVVGPDIARIARPVKVSHARGSMGATLTVLTTGAHAPMLEMQKEQIRAKVNAVYGYNAISRLRLTQTAPTGFDNADARSPDSPAPAARPSPDVVNAARDAAQPVRDDGLRAALERLGQNVLTKVRP